MLEGMNEIYRNAIERNGEDKSKKERRGHEHAISWAIL
jgi:hypothetical protein